MVASYGLRSYHAISVQAERNFVGRTTLSYIATNIRQARISNVEIPTPDTIVITEEIDGSLFATRIFKREGMLIGSFGRHQPGAAAFETELAAVNSFEAAFIADDLLEITLGDNDGRTYSIVLSLGPGRSRG